MTKEQNNISMEIIFNEQFKRANIHFTGKPSEEIRNEMKKEGWQYSAYNDVWYPKGDEASKNSYDFAKQLQNKYFEQTDIQPELITEEIEINELMQMIQNKAELSDVITKLCSFYGDNEVKKSFEKAEQKIELEQKNEEELINKTAARENDESIEEVNFLRNKIQASGLTADEETVSFIVNALLHDPRSSDKDYHGFIHKNDYINGVDDNTSYIGFSKVYEGSKLSMNIPLITVLTDTLNQINNAVEFEKSNPGYFNISYYDINGGKENIDNKIKEITQLINDLTVSNQFITDYVENKTEEFKYQLLNRMQSDIKNFQNEGNHNEEVLWAKNLIAQTTDMKILYNSLKEKPEWINLKEINNYINENNFYSEQYKNAVKHFSKMNDKEDFFNRIIPGHIENLNNPLPFDVDDEEIRNEFESRDKTRNRAWLQAAKERYCELNNNITYDNDIINLNINNNVAVNQESDIPENNFGLYFEKAAELESKNFILKEYGNVHYDQPNGPQYSVFTDYHKEITLYYNLIKK